MRRNVASQVVGAQLVALADGTDVTSGTTTVYVTGDNGTQTAGSGTVTHKGNGLWNYVPTQAETNYQHVVFTFKNTLAITASVQQYPVIRDANGYAGVDIKKINAVTVNGDGAGTPWGP